MKTTQRKVKAKKVNRNSAGTLTGPYQSHGIIRLTSQFVPNTLFSIWGYEERKKAKTVSLARMPTAEKAV